MGAENSPVKPATTVFAFMNLRYYHHLPLLLCLLITACAGSDEDTRTEETTTSTRHLSFTSSVSFLDSQGEDISTVEVAVADDDHTRSEGLMDVHDLPDNSGMLFIFDSDEERSFWMANTPIPLDIIFVNSEYEIVRIHRNAAPYSHQSFRSEAPAKYVVEVNAGYTIRHDINEGMMIRINE